MSKETERTTTKGLDAEVKAIGVISKLLGDLDDAGRHRVMDWMLNRYGPKPKTAVPRTADVGSHLDG